MATKEGGDAPPKKCTALKPLTACNIVSYYAPIFGSASYGLLAVNVLNPSLNLGLLSKRDATNVLLAGTLVGTGCYIYSRPHIRAAQKNGLLYAAYGSVVFTFGSILSWAILRSILPNNVAVGTVAGLATCYAIAKTGKDYLGMVDSQIAKK